jgi:signal transduction histidine kinase
MPWRWVSLVIALVLLPAFAWRRTHPLVVVVVCFGTVLALSLAQLVARLDEVPGLYTMAALILVLYALFRWGSGRECLAGAVIVFATTTACVVADSEGLSDVIGGYAVVGIVLAVGAAVRFQGRARQRELAQVRLLEREQIARDLHDIVAHHVSAIVIRAQAGLAVAPTRPAAAPEALRVIESEASRTLAEMRSMVGVLRAPEPAQLGPTPALDDLHQLAAAGHDGPRVDVAVADGLGDVEPALATALFRMAQESVTNTRRHGRHVTLITVTVTGDASEVRLRVADDGDAVDGRRNPDGYGIVGMAERADLLGGRCEAGPGRDRRWVVSAVLPRRQVAV